MCPRGHRSIRRDMADHASDAFRDALLSRRAEAVERRDAETKIIREIDALLASTAAVAPKAPPAPKAKKPATKKPAKKAPAHEPPKGFGTKPGGIPAKVLAILKERAGTPTQAAEIVDMIAANTTPVPTGPARHRLDTQVRNALSNAYQDSSSGVVSVSYGYYCFGEPVLPKKEGSPP